MPYNNDLKRLPDPYHKSGVGFVSSAINGVATGTIHKLNGGGIITNQYQGGFWEIDISFPETVRGELDTVIPFLESLEGTFTSFYVQLPQYRYPKTGPWDVSTPTLTAQNEITLVSSKVVSISNWSTRGGDLSVGDMLKFSNMNKIYQITDAYLDGDTKYLELSSAIKYPSLIPVAYLEPNDILFKVNLANNKTPKPTLSPNGIYSSFSISVRENTLGEYDTVPFPGYLGPYSDYLVDPSDPGTIPLWFDEGTGVILCNVYIQRCREKIPCL